MEDSTYGSRLEDTDLDPADLAARVRARDQAAIGEVVRAYLPQIVGAARGAGLDPATAEDVAQSTFLTFIETAPRFEGRSRVRTWLFGILYRKISEARRSMQKTEKQLDIDTIFEQSFDSAGNWVRPPRPSDAEVYASEVRAGIESCLDTLSTKQRMAFTLREVEDMGSGEICKILDVSRTNFGVLLHRARTSLRSCLEKRGLRG